MRFLDRLDKNLVPDLERVAPSSIKPAHMITGPMNLTSRSTRDTLKEQRFELHSFLSRFNVPRVSPYYVESYQEEVA